MLLRRMLPQPPQPHAPQQQQQRSAPLNARLLQKTSTMVA
jgi:hypothetical protein